jgi:peroxiredoxin Q/BCP
MTAAAKKLDTNTLAEGQQAPDFTLPTDEGSVTLSSFKGKSNVVVYFYPKDDTPGCTKQACAARDLAADFKKANTVVIGISKDSETSHGKFRTKYQLSHILGSDADGKVCEAFGAWGEKSMYGKKYMGIMRNCYLIDKKGTLVKQWKSVKPEGSLEAALAEAKKLA